MDASKVVPVPMSTSTTRMGQRSEVPMKVKVKKKLSIRTVFWLSNPTGNYANGAIDSRINRDGFALSIDCGL